ncbi:hypothetical protein L596_005600 [Steinernema carpocapsae]|nr:hypothetical protein L596_005600 [Steinernema carpocapsae]
MPVPRDARIHPQYYVIFGRMHAENAVFLILVLKIVYSVIEFLLGIAYADSLGTIVEVMFEGLGIFEIVAMFFAYKHKNHQMLILPILVQMFLSTVMFMSLTLTICIFIYPTTAAQEVFGHHDNRTEEVIVSVIFFLITMWYVFCTRSLFACYKYYEDKHTLKPRNNNDLNERMTFTDPVMNEPSSSGVTISFENPNYETQAEGEPFSDNHGNRSMV